MTSSLLTIVRLRDARLCDLDWIEYTDMSIMGFGTNILGYARPEVDEADMETVQSGNMSTFKCPYESFLAEKLVELHSWANMVRFTISSGKANAIAIGIAREAAGNDTEDTATNQLVIVAQ